MTLKNRFYLSWVVAIILSLVLIGCLSTDREPETILFSFAENSQDAGTSAYFTLYFKTNTLVIWEDPRFTWDNTNINLYDIEWQILDLSELLEKEKTYVESLAYASYEGDLIIVFVYSNLDFAGSKIARIDGESLNAIWVTDFHGPNIGEPIIRSSSLYVTSIGAVGKVDMASGEFLWQHIDLYDQETKDFNSFKTPVFNGTEIIFQGKNIFSTCPKRIEINDLDGTILNIVETCFP
ncbi:MAG: hypothetical protein R3D55_06460 [Chloroflexota bacterium]